MSPEDADRLGVAEGEVVRVTSRRGSLEVAGPGRSGPAPGPRVHDAALPRPGRQRTSSRSTPPTRSPGPPSSRRPRSGSTKTLRVGGGLAPPWTSSCPTTSPATTKRAAVDAVLGAPRPRAGSGGERTEADGRVRSGRARGARNSATCCSRPARAAVGRGLDQPGRARATPAERLTVPPAEAYGVATFYAMFCGRAAADDRSLHLCDDIACKVAGAEGLIERGRSRQVGSGAGAPEPCLGMCERAPAALLQGSGSRDVAFGPRLDPNGSTRLPRGGPLDER